MTVWQTVLVFGVVPLGIYTLIAAVTLGRGHSRPPRYRPGQRWDYEPVWWTADAEGADLPELPTQSAAGPAGSNPSTDARPGARTARGGASGSW